MWAETLIDSLVVQGVSLFVISPGSRSTPLTLAVARHPGARHIIAYDERGAAYVAVGYARATGIPVGLICTSGTAAASYLPAVTEASNSARPMVILTADRPPELHDIGANQTMNQQELYGGFVRRFINVPPDDQVADAARGLAEQTVSACLSPVPGPVHINCMFREPFQLAPAAEAVARTEPASRPAKAIDPNAIAALVTLISQANHPMLLVGDLATASDVAAVGKLADHLGWPVWADIRSGLRGIPDVLRSTCELREQITGDGGADFVLHLGGSLISKPLHQYLETGFDGTYCKVPGDGRELDPTGCCGMFVKGDVAALCTALTPACTVADAVHGLGDASTTYDILAGALQEESRDGNALSEASVAYLLSANFPPGRGLFLGNSMPVRFCDRFALGPCLPPMIAANRGVSGIDGTLASALGFSLGCDSPVVCVLGDLSFIHDMSSLSLLRAAPHPILVIVVNNQGGGIFHHLPIAEQDDVFEDYFVTPHSFNFEGAAQQFGLAYSRVRTNDAFVACLRDPEIHADHHLVELCVEQESNMAAYARMSAVPHGGA